MAEDEGPVGYGSPKEDLPLERREMFGPQYRLVPSRRAQPAWPKCRHNEYVVVQVLEGPNDGGRRFFRCPRSGVQITNSTFFVIAYGPSMFTVLFRRWRNATSPAGSTLLMNGIFAVMWIHYGLEYGTWSTEWRVSLRRTTTSANRCNARGATRRS